MQNGFISGRIFLCNVVGNDAFARFVSYPSHRHLLPLIVLFDIKAAFPSIAHEWLFLSLEAAGANAPLLNFVRALYDHVRVFVNIEGNINYAFNAKVVF